ncbi:ATP-dependent RNA helicase [Galdieria sulphuraria]|uniref:RNA helicase n=1 Tax=Galdieria sulphuraria TaxID=130081 RepID=M2XX77_GALSU|nr:ATP-dependent RNA helicase [Galdieria sulphuraria]EME28233.1 ATP-dependent RNA helicase [Galdieria sulphuraria]|eukprot:XP_005704753.1 ATP-dependent RNA helicase [Galdieria sulphuraria]
MEPKSHHRSRHTSPPHRSSSPRLSRRRRHESKSPSRNKASDHHKKRRTRDSGDGIKNRKEQGLLRNEKGEIIENPEVNTEAQEMLERIREEERKAFAIPFRHQEDSELNSEQVQEDRNNENEKKFEEPLQRRKVIGEWSEERLTSVSKKKPAHVALKVNKVEPTKSLSSNNQTSKVQTKDSVSSHNINEACIFSKDMEAENDDETLEGGQASRKSLEELRQELVNEKVAYERQNAENSEENEKDEELEEQEENESKRMTQSSQILVEENSVETNKSISMNEDDPLDQYMEDIQKEVNDVLIHSRPKKKSSFKKNGVLEDSFEWTEENSNKEGDERISSDEGGELLSDMEGEDAELIDAGDVSDRESGYLSHVRRKRIVYEKVDHSKYNYIHFKKNFYIEAPEIAKMSWEDVHEYRKQLGGIRIRGRNCPKPVKTWGQCGLSSSVLDTLRKLRFEKPTAIQAQSIPAIMNGRDVIGIAKTGSGKTLAYVLPMLRHIAAQPPLQIGDGPIGLIVAPTRELAIQIYGEIKRFAKALDIKVVCAYGGSGIGDQIAKLKVGAEVVVCTPGRMIDLLSMNGGRATNLRRVTYLVIDEADRMFDMGFEPQVTRIAENVRPDRQTVMFSATFPPQVENLARKILSQPIEIVVGGRSVAASSIEQFVEVRKEETKFLRLLELIGDWYDKGSILVFVDRQENADRIFNDLILAGYRCMSLHGGLDQADRDSTIADFKNGLVKILVATSVAARGLDVKHLRLVINYDVPNHYEDYVHRVGRTGRAGNPGTAYTFITPEQEVFAPDLVRAVELSAKAAAQEVIGSSNSDEANEFISKYLSKAIPPELRHLVTQFEQKRKVGLAHFAGSGYGGKGYKFNEEEEESTKKLRKAQAREYGLDLGDEEEESATATRMEEVDDEVVVREISTETSEDTVKGTSDLQPITDDEVRMAVAEAGALAEKNARQQGLPPEEIAKRVAQAKAQALSNQSALQRTRAMQLSTKGITGASGKQNVSESAELSAAARAAALINAKLGLVMGAPLPGDGFISNGGQGGSERRFATEVEINDYPQHARWKVTHKDALLAVEEWTGCAITTKGQYYPPGRNPPPGERKLYLLIEGPDELSVRKASKDIRIQLEEAASSARPDDKPSYGKYSVL